MRVFGIYKTIFLATLLVAGIGNHPALAHEGHADAAPARVRDLGTAAAFDDEGRLWAVSKQIDNGGQYLVLQRSTDMGASWTPAARIQKKPEPIAASGEARPHIAFGRKGEIYISYTSTVASPHIGDIRFVRSLDGGQSFSEPITVHANRDFIVHSFESMVVDPEGKLYIAWIDGRDAAQAKKAGKSYAGSAVYYAVSDDGGASFRGDFKLADHSCECCRVGLALDSKGRAFAMWRHVFDPNIRDHALSELHADGKPSDILRVTFDDWRVDACPHHGPSLAYGADGRRHQVWFSGKGGTGGAHYAVAAPDGKLSAPVVLGGPQASHPDVAVQGKRIAVAWKQFDGKSTALIARVSRDGGKTWTEKETARTAGVSDNPYLINSPSALVLVWRTEQEGIRAYPLGR